MTNLFNTITDQIVTNIIHQLEAPQRARMIEIYIEVLGQLLDSQHPLGEDLFCAMAISAALNTNAVDRLHATKKLVPNLKKFEDIMATTLLHIQNHKNIREIHKTHRCIPFIGVYLKDRAFSGENSVEQRTDQIGKIINSVLKTKSWLTHNPAINLTDLANIIELKIQNEEQTDPEPLYQRSCALEPAKIYLLTSETQLNSLVEYLSFILKIQLPLQIRYEEKSYTGQPAFEQIQGWLSRYFSAQAQKSTCIHQVVEVADLAARSCAQSGKTPNILPFVQSLHMQMQSDSPRRKAGVA